MEESRKTDGISGLFLGVCPHVHANNPLVIRDSESYTSPGIYQGKRFPGVCPHVHGGKRFRRGLSPRARAGS